MRLLDHQLGPSCHLHSAVTHCLTPLFVGATSELGRKHAPLQSLCRNYPAPSVDDGEGIKVIGGGKAFGEKVVRMPITGVDSRRLKV